MTTPAAASAAAPRAGRTEAASDGTAGGEQRRTDLDGQPAAPPSANHDVSSAPTRVSWVCPGSVTPVEWEWEHLATSMAAADPTALSQRAPVDARGDQPLNARVEADVKIYDLRT